MAGLPASEAAPVMFSWDGADVAGVADAELQAAVTLQVVAGGQARAEGRVVGSHDALAVLGVVLVVAEADVAVSLFVTCQQSFRNTPYL